MEELADTGNPSALAAASSGDIFDVQPLAIEGGIFDLQTTTIECPLGGKDFEIHAADVCPQEFQLENQGEPMASNHCAIRDCERRVSARAHALLPDVQRRQLFLADL